MQRENNGDILGHDMQNVNENIKIVSIRELLGEELSIPGYQRPYRWSTESAATLVTDTYGAWMNEVPEYRIGSVVLHRDKEKGVYHIVDGQQRLTTLSIIIYCYCLKQQDDTYLQKVKLLDAQYNALSQSAIRNNYEIISRKINEIDDAVIDKYITYLLDKCTLVKIVTESEQEAFQFFDSQNARGKALEPHDLLKSYHLREMRDEPEASKIEIINAWEATKQKELADFFKNHLYPLVRWYKCQSGLNYSSKEIRTFKGIKKDNTYNYSIYNRAAHLYIERFNSEGMYELASRSPLNQFQLTQPVIAGKRFFQYTLHYFRLYQEIEARICFAFREEDIPNRRSGDIYIRNLFVNVLMFYVDKFNMEALTDSRMNRLYKWAYSLRLVMKAVYQESVNRYAQGYVERVNYNLKMFTIISEMQEPSQLDTIILERVERKQFEDSKVNISHYEHIWKNLFGPKESADE
jgi:hypothetical protein